MVRPRGKKQEAPAEAEQRPPWKDGMDVNAVVSYNVKAARERRGMTQEDVADGLARLTGHRLPQASISAMERGFDGARRRRFDAHELYLLAMVFDVPIAYFFLPPPKTGAQVLADAQRPVSELYAWLLGKEWQLPLMDERLVDINVKNPEEVDELLLALYGGDADDAARNWHEHFRTWRKKRLAILAKNYGDRLDDVAEFLAEFALEVRQLGPKDYLLSKAHREGEDVSDPDLDDEE
jgi:transcriptional regulator with XRE-family HTH domain